MDGMIQNYPQMIEVAYQGSANFTVEITGTADNLLFNTQWGGLRLYIEGELHFEADVNALYNTYELEPQCYVDMTVMGDFQGATLEKLLDKRRMRDSSGGVGSGSVDVSGSLESYMRDGTVVDTQPLTITVTNVTDPTGQYEPPM